MRWLRKLYLGEKAAGQADSLIRTAERGKKSGKDSCCLIALSTFPNGELDLLTFSESRNKAWQGQKLMILGLAADRSEALGLLEKMTNECLQSTGSLRLKEYFGSREFVSWREVSL